MEMLQIQCKGQRVKKTPNPRNLEAHNLQDRTQSNRIECCAIRILFLTLSFFKCIASASDRLLYFSGILSLQFTRRAEHLVHSQARRALNFALSCGIWNLEIFGLRDGCTTCFERAAKGEGSCLFAQFRGLMSTEGFIVCNFFREIGNLKKKQNLGLHSIFLITPSA